MVDMLSLKELYRALEIVTPKSLTNYQKVALRIPCFRESVMARSEYPPPREWSEKEIKIFSKVRYEPYTPEEVKLLKEVQRAVRGRYKSRKVDELLKKYRV